MRTAILALSGALALAAVAPPALAQAQGANAAVNKNDVRCVLVLSLIGRDPKNEAAAKQGTYFYWGRLVARGASTSMTPLMLAEAKSFTNQTQIQAELTRCGNELNATSQQLATAMKSFQAAAQPPAGAAGAPAAAAPAAPATVPPKK